MKNNCVRLGVLFFVIFILCNCTYNYEDNKKNYSYDFKKIDLSVASLEIKNLNLDHNYDNDSVEKKIFESLLAHFEKWALNKFRIQGKNNNANIFLEKLEPLLIEKKTEKKSKYSILEKDKDIYKTKFIFSLLFSKENAEDKILKISSSVDLFLLSNYSIQKREQVIESYVKKIIQLIDNKVSSDLTNKAFAEFILINQ